MRNSHACLGEKSGGGANDPTEKCSARRPCGARHRRRGKFGFGRRIRNVPKSVERRHHRLAVGRAAARPASIRAWKRLTSVWPSVRPPPERSSLAALASPARDRAGGTVAVGAGLELLGRQLLACRSCKRSITTTAPAAQRARAALVRALRYAGCSRRLVLPPIRSLTRSLCPGTWVAAGSCRPLSTLSPRTARISRRGYYAEPGLLDLGASVRGLVSGQQLGHHGNFFYDINTKSTGICCAGALGTGVTSGNSLYGDLHALYKFGKWSIGPVGYFEVQTTSDTGCSVLQPRWASATSTGSPRSAPWLATILARSTFSSGSPTPSLRRTHRKAMVV